MPGVIVLRPLQKGKLGRLHSIELIDPAALGGWGLAPDPVTLRQDLLARGLPLWPSSFFKRPD